MKKYFVCISILCLSMITCKKFEEGPQWSPFSIKSRITNTWVFESLSYGGTDLSSQFMADHPGFELNISKGDNFTLAGLDSATISGTWKLGEDKDDIYLDPNGLRDNEIAFRILRLTNKQFWARHSLADGTRVIYHFKKK